MAPALPPVSGNRWMFRAAGGILAGGIAAAVAGFFLQKNDLALGFLLGCFISAANFYALHLQTRKFLSRGGQAMLSFWFWNILRWLAFVLVCWALIRLSVQCLLGAMGTYLWSLLVLGWAGSHSSSAPKTPGTSKKT